MNEEPQKPKLSTTIIGWVVALVIGSLLALPFASGHILNNTTFDMYGEEIIDWSSMLIPGIGAVLVLALMAFDIRYRFLATAYGAISPRYYEATTQNEDEYVEAEESRPAVKNVSAKELKRLHAEAWSELYARHDALIIAWSKYETDVALMIDYPIMTDYTDPVVHKVIAAMQKIRTAKMRMEEDSGIEAHESSFLEAVNEFELSFHAAERYARRYGQTRLDPREQRKLSAARAALNIILDGSAPSFEIEAAYKSLRSSLKGIIDVPEKAIVEIEALVRREVASN